jgi:hypothetical protein
LFVILYCTVEEKACLIRLIATKRAGLKVELQETEKELFAALPPVIQKMLVGRDKV